MAKSFLDKAGVPYEVIDAEENRALVEKYGVRQAPTLIDIERGAVHAYANASNIRHYAETRC